MRAPAAWSKTEQSVRCHDGTKDIIMHRGVSACVREGGKWLIVSSSSPWPSSARKRLTPRIWDDQRSNKWHDAGCCVFGPTLWHPERLTRAIVWWQWCMDIHQGNRFLSDRAWIMTLLIWPCRRVGGDGWFDSKPLFAAKLFWSWLTWYIKMMQIPKNSICILSVKAAFLFDKISLFLNA